jgi:hypothetical protein
MESIWYVGHSLDSCTSPEWWMRVGDFVEWELARKTEVLGEKTTLAPVCPPQIPHNLTQARTRALLRGKPATNRLSYGTAFVTRLM